MGLSGRTPFVSVVVPVYNDSVRLARCLKVLRAQTYPKETYEVIVVDNASEQDIRGVVCLFPGIVYTCENYPGPAASRNKGITLSKGDIVAFTDSDCMPHPDWIEKGIERFFSEPSIGVVGGEIVTYFENPEKPTMVELFDRNYFKQRELIKDRHFSATANLFVRREVFARAGLFDISFSLCACEDREWGERAHAMGVRLIFADNAVVAHPCRRTLSQMASRNAEFAIGNYQYEMLRYKKGMGVPPTSLVKEAAMLFRLPFRSAGPTLRPLRGVWRKMQMYFIVLFNCYTRVGANILVRMGWKPARGFLRKNWSGHGTA